MPRSPTRQTRVSPNRVLELGDLGGQGFRVGGVAVEHLDGDRHPGRSSTAARRRSATGLSPRRGHARSPPAGRCGPRTPPRTRHRAPACRWPNAVRPSEFSMASWRASTQSIAAYRSSSSQPATPSTAPSELVAVCGAQPARGGQLGARRDHLGDQHRGHQVAAPRAAPGRSAPPCPVPARCPAPRPHARGGRLRVISNASARSPRRRQALERALQSFPPCARASATGWPGCGFSPCRFRGSFRAAAPPAVIPGSAPASHT